MAVLQITFAPSFNGGAYDANLMVANREFFIIGGTSFYIQNFGQYYLGALDVLNSVFPDHPTAASYYYTNNHTSFRALVNAQVDLQIGTPVNFFTSDVYVELIQGAQNIVDSKQPLASTLTDLSALTIAPDMMAAMGSPTGLAGFSAAAATSLALDTMSTKSAADYSTTTQMNTALAGKVSTVSGKGLSTEDYTTAEKTKLAGLSAPAALSFANPSVSLNTAGQISGTRHAYVTYSVDISCTMSLTSGQSGLVVLEYADDAGFTTNVKTVSRSPSANSGALTIGLALTNLGSGLVSGVIPAGKYRRIRTVNTTGTPTFTMQNAQEVLI